MLNRATLARPYARAAFEAARDDDALVGWAENLDLAAAIAVTPEVHALSSDPRVGRERLLELFSDIGEGRFDQRFVNFLRTLAANRRLGLLPEIAAQYRHYWRESQKHVKVEVTSAMPMSEEETRELIERLKKRFGREVELEVEVDESLIAGAVIRTGDQVIDGSVRGRLEQLGRRMTA